MTLTSARAAIRSSTRQTGGRVAKIRATIAAGACPLSKAKGGGSARGQPGSGRFNWGCGWRLGVDIAARFCRRIGKVEGAVLPIGPEMPKM
jgi:hypothetical protein